MKDCIQQAVLEFPFEFFLFHLFQTNGIEAGMVTLKHDRPLRETIWAQACQIEDTTPGVYPYV